MVSSFAQLVSTSRFGYFLVLFAREEELFYQRVLASVSSCRLVRMADNVSSKEEALANLSVQRPMVWATHDGFKRCWQNFRFAVIKMLPFGSDLILADGCWWKPYREAEAAWNLIDRNRILVKDWEAKPSIWAPLRFWTPRPLSPPSSPSTIFFVRDIPLWVLGGVENDFKKSLKIILGPHFSEQTLFLLYNSCVFWGDGKLSYQEPRSRCHGGMPIWQFISICFCWQKVLLKDIWSTLHRQVSKSMMCMIYDYNWLYEIIYIKYVYIIIHIFELTFIIGSAGLLDLPFPKEQLPISTCYFV